MSAHAIPVCSCSTLPVVTMFNNKALQMDPYVSRLVNPITEYSAPPGSSGFSNKLWSGMDASYQIFDLRQGRLSIEEYVTQFCLLSNKVHFDEVALKDIFRFGLNEPIKSWLPEGQFNVRLRDFMDYALLCAGSSFTVGVVEEESGTASEMVDAPECVHKMAATTTPRHVSAASKESSQVTADVKESSQVTADVKESSQVTADVKESSQVTADVKESSQVTADVKESSKSPLMLKSQVKSPLMLKSQVKSTLMLRVKASLS